MLPILHNSPYHFTNHITYFILPYELTNILYTPNMHSSIIHPSSFPSQSPQISEYVAFSNQNLIHTENSKDWTTKDIEENETVTKRQKTGKVQKKRTNSQRYGRNICSNILHIIIKKVLYYKEYENDILKIIQKYGMQIKIQQFYSKLYFKQNKLKEYVPFDKIIEFYTGHKNKIKQGIGIKRHQEFCKILRTITHLYLHREHVPLSINCNKLKKQSKYFHLRQSHKLQSILRGTYKQDYKS